jgi:hypothetical protein
MDEPVTRGAPTELTVAQSGSECPNRVQWPLCPRCASSRSSLIGGGKSTDQARSEHPDRATKATVGTACIFASRRYHARASKPETLL